MLEIGGLSFQRFGRFDFTMSCLGVVSIDNTRFGLAQSTLILHYYGMMFLAPKTS